MASPHDPLPNIPPPLEEPPGGALRKLLSPAAERALKEAALRRAEADRGAAARAGEVGGPAGPEPTRYGDWEKKGLTSDF
jgi:hypothetical protein